MMTSQPPAARPPNNPTYIGHVVGASFGLVFVLVNSAPMAAALRIAVCALAVIAFAVVLAAFLRTARGTGDAIVGFTRRFWIVVGVEAILLFGGLAIMRRIDPAAALGWIALVVGVHFFPLSRLWTAGRGQLVAIAGAMTALGVAGLILAFTTHDADAVALVSGVGSGVVLLGSAVVVAVPSLSNQRG